MSEVPYPFLLTPSTIPVAFTSNGSTASTQALWAALAATQTPGIRQIIVQNPAGNPTFYIAVGTSSGVAATSNSHQIYAGTIQTFSVNEVNNYFSALSASGTATLTVTPGAGE